MASTQLIRIVRWIARLGSLASIGLLSAFLIGEGGVTLQLSMGEWLGLLLFPGGVIIGMILGWWREGWGSVLVFVSLAAFYVQQFMLDGNIPRGPWFFIFALPGLFFAVSWWLSHREDQGGGGNRLHTSMQA